MALTSLLDPVWDETLDELEGLQRRRAQDFAAEARLLARLSARTTRGGWQSQAPYDSLVLDVAGTCVVGQQAAAGRLADAEHLVGRLPHTLAALDRGLLHVPQARVLIDETRPLTPAVCAEVESRVLTDAELLTPGALRRRVRRIILTVDADQAARRAAATRSDRRVWARPGPDGTRLLLAEGPADQLHRLELRLDALARGLHTDGDPRTLDQLRFDLLCESGGPDPTGRHRPAQVLVHVPVATALGLSDEPGTLVGHGPLAAAQVRELLTDAELRKVCVDATTGRVVGTENTVVRPAGGDPTVLRRHLLDMISTPTVVDDRPEAQHDPSAALARRIRFRDQRCDGPGCSVPADRCELDHHQPWPAGPTSFANLTARSQRCHHAKHHGWHVTRHPDGHSQWTSPGGRSYLVLTPDDPPPTIHPGQTLDPPEQVTDRDRRLLTPDEDLAAPR
jgi:hypothetical protein